jgi:hypothetical protein
MHAGTDRPRLIGRWVDDRLVVRRQIARIVFRIGRRVVVVDGSLGDGDQGTTAQLGLRDSNRSNLLIESPLHIVAESPHQESTTHRG